MIFVRTSSPYFASQSPLQVRTWRYAVMRPATARIATEPTAILENGGTARAASSQRSPRLRTSASVRNASPPAQSPAVTTCATSETSASVPAVLACPDAEGVIARPAQSASGRPDSIVSRSSVWRRASAVTDSVAASAAWMSMTLP